MRIVELPPGISNHADMVRSLAGSLLELEAVLPLYQHRFELNGSERTAQAGTVMSKFKALDPLLYKGERLRNHRVERVFLADLIEPPVLRTTGFCAYLSDLLEKNGDESSSRRIVPDLWFEPSPVKANCHGLRGEVLGLIEVVDSSDLTSEKWDAFLDLAEHLDCIESIWVCLLRREIHSPYFSCEFFGP
jgi:hypothetical protein